MGGRCVIELLLLKPLLLLLLRQLRKRLQWLLRISYVVAAQAGANHPPRGVRVRLLQGRHKQ